MENQPPANQLPATTGRQWFRLASLARLESLRQPDAPPAPAPAAPSRPNQAPVPRIPLPRSQAEPFQPQPQPQPEPQLPPRPLATPSTLPADSGSSQAPVATQATQSRTAMPPPPDSPRAIKQPSPNPLPESPKIQQQLRPIKTPTPQPEPEPNPSPAPTNNMFMQQLHQGNSIPSVHVKTIADIIDKPPANGNLSHVGEKEETSPWNKEERGKMNVITMAGENMGAYMEIGKQRQRGYLLQQHKTKGGESPIEDGKSCKAAGAKGKHMAALVNSNVQSINNSIIFRSSCAHHSPGVRMTLISRRRPKRHGGH